MFALQQRVHSTWLFTVLCVGFLAGVSLARYITPVGAVYLWLGILMAGFSFWHRRAWMLVIAFVAGGVVGLWRGGIEVADLSKVQMLYGKHIQLTGTISDDPEYKKGSLAIRINGVKLDNQALAGTFYITVEQNNSLRRGDVITVDGKMGDGFGSFVATMYRAKLIEVSRPKDLLLDLRDAFSAAVRGILPETSASLGLGILVGQKSELPSDFSDALKIAGLTHIVVASGYNLTILVRLSRRLFGKLSRYQAVLWSVVLILSFITITGWGASMVRAGLVAGLSLWAWYYGREFHPVTLLSFAAAVTVVFSPSYLWGDIGWALSFAAFAGVLILAPLLHAYFYGDTKPGFVAQTLLETLSAQVATLPIMIGVFGQFSVVALLSNLMILPLVPMGMLFTFCAGLVQMIVPALTPLVVWPAQIVLGYFVWAVNWTASFPWAQITWQMPAWAVGLSYLFIICVCVYLQFKTKYQLRKVNVVE